MTNAKSLRGLAAVATMVAAGAAAMRAEATPSLVIDVPTGAVISQDQATASWYPASLTKLMTTYVALDAVRQGRISMETPLMVSPRAARMAPSKMGFRPGSEVTLQNALIMLMVKSANDIAVSIAEGVSGSVEAFADEMNRASASLGMTGSHWVNPNGLPDSRQVTSARDLAILGRALYLQFPEYSGLYSIGAMQFGNKIEQNHNGLIGRYPGADGMKTGFTCPAGFNLVASATHGGQKLIAVVLGAPSAAARTAKAAALLDRAFQTGAAMSSLASLPSAGPTAAPDMRDRVCRNRGAATAEFMAEVEDMSIPVGSASTGIPLLDSFGNATQRVSVKDIARLPRQHTTPVQVYAGRAPGYVGPVARARAPGAPVGQQPDLAAYAPERSEAAGPDASPISRAAPDATALRQAGRRGKRLAVRNPEPVADIAAPDSASDAAPAVKPKAAAKTPAKAAGKTAAKPKPKDAKSAAKPAAGKAPQAQAAKTAPTPAAKPAPAPKPAAAKPAPKVQAANKQGKT